MIRRTFLHLLAGIPLPGLRWHQAFSPKSAFPPTESVPFPSSNDTPDPEWLLDWLRLPRLPVISADLPQIADPQQRALAALILQRIRSGSPFDFHYFGGSEPGKFRSVLPVLVFTTALDDLPCGAAVPNPLYLLAWCQSRAAPRTFRLDRMQDRASP
jgi:hypothetical protein